ncbi:MAG: type II toxin-antitoxin system VapB family antitoxin [Candidatus Acidiferrum sp.]
MASKGASLNIKNSETHKLAQALARETGESLTTAVTTAIRERLEAISRKRKSKATLAAIRAISARITALDKGPYIDHAEMLYDEHGLPK